MRSDLDNDISLILFGMKCMNIIYIILLSLTFLSFSEVLGMNFLTSFPLLPMTIIKFILILFGFMELRKASLVWQAILSGVLVVYSILVVFLFS